MSVLLQPLQLAAADGLLSHAVPMPSPECSTLRQQQGLTEPQAPSAARMEQGAQYSGWSELLPCEMHRKQDKRAEAIKWQWKAMHMPHGSSLV